MIRNAKYEKKNPPLVLSPHLKEPQAVVGPQGIKSMINGFTIFVTHLLCSPFCSLTRSTQYDKTAIKL